MADNQQCATSTVYDRSVSGGCFRQGEILSNLAYATIALDTLNSSESPDLDIDIYPYVIIVTQDCDLNWDYQARKANEHRKYLPSILFCEVNTAENLRGTDKPPLFDSKQWKMVYQNKNERYQYLECVPPEADLIGKGLPSLGIDFKRYFTMPTAEVYHRVTSGETARRCYLRSPYLEHFACRFAFYMSRVGLPKEHEHVTGIVERPLIQASKARETF